MIPSKPCPKARKRTGRKAKPMVVHPPHHWIAGQYLPVGDLGYQAKCPGVELGDDSRPRVRR